MSKVGKVAKEEEAKVKKDLGAAEAASSSAINPEAVLELNDTLEPTVVEDQRLSMPNPTSVAVPNNDGGLAGERPVPDRKADANLRAAAMRAEQEEAMREKTYTADKLAETQGKAALAANMPDFEKTQEDYQSEIQKKGFAQWALDTKADAEQRIADAEARERESKRNAAWAGAAEMASSIANLVAVGKHNAVSQQYKNYSQDWMQKADSDAREHRNRIDDLRKLQRETELKMNQITQQGIQAAIENDRRREQTRLENEYRQAQIEYQKARTDAERQEAELKKQESAAKIANLEAQAKQRLMQGQAAVTRANNPGKGKSNAPLVDTPIIKSQGWVDMFNAKNNSANGMNRYMNTFGTQPAKDKGKEEKSKSIAEELSGE